jgi:N-acetylneuraminic acid mutarotase
MIVWGGDNGNAIARNSGGRFNPATDTWTATAIAGAPPARLSHTAVWTGTEMIVWGGLSGAFSFQTLGDGARYNPQTDTWSPITTVGAPNARFDHTAVWTGTEMIIWGGSSCTGCNGEVATGARYNPVTDTWVPTSATAAPSARDKHTTVWTGSSMIVWGGQNDTTLLDTGGIYDPVSDAWSSTNPTGAPIPRSEHAAAWTGSSMVVFGGRFSNSSAGTTDTGGMYDPVSGQWTPTATAGAPGFNLGFGEPSVWTGAELILWNGGGGRFDPAANSWSGISTSGIPSIGTGHSAVWTGSTMIVWGGGPGVPPLNTGGIYDPSLDQTP